MLSILNRVAQIPIQTLIERLGLIVALSVAILTPLCFALVSVRHLQSDLDFKARLGAERVARYAVLHESHWQYQGLRLSEIIDLGSSSSNSVHQLVSGPQGQRIVEVGSEARAPLLTVKAPILSRGDEIGYLEARTSALPVIHETLLVGLLSALLGVAAFAALRVLPLRALAHALERLNAANVEARNANSQLVVKNEELNRLNDHLESIVAARTQQAEAAAQEAREANKVKSAFLASMSHEIRTPMNGVLGMADLLTRTEMTQHQQRLVATIMQSAETLLGIINDILDHSRIEAEKVELDLLDLDLRECVESSVGLLTEAAHKKGLEISLLIPSALPARVVGDGGRLRQVLLNLVGNAVKFTSAGHVAVRIAMLSETDGKALVKFSVSDTGIGIDPVVQKTLFSPFAQADTTITRRFGGTGLGLSISQGLVRLMGGEITLASEPGMGTTIEFTVPFAISSRLIQRTAVCPAVIQDQRVLVVDDHATNREVICCYLAECGAHPEQAASAETALAMVKAGAAAGSPYALVVLDMILPSMNGLELARCIKTSLPHAETRLILVTSLSWKGETQTARHAGIGAFLNKPIRRDDLLRAIRECFAIVEHVDDGSGKKAVMNQVPAAKLAGLRVLLAEDNPVNQEVMREYAASLDCLVSVSGNGAEAVDLFQKSDFDVVLMDCQMPVMDGLTACRKIREIERERGQRRTPVLAVTANAYEGDRVACLAAEMDDVLTKPCTLPQLLGMLEKWSPAIRRPANGGGANVAATPAGAKLEPSAFDEQALRELEACQPGMAERMIELYLSTAPKSVRQIMTGVIELDLEKIAAAAHSLKSASGSIGANAMSEIARQVEEHAHSKQPIARILVLGLKLEAELCNTERAFGQITWIGKRKKAG